MIRIFKLLLFFNVCNGLWSQTIPPIQKYDLQEYEVGTQNWMITQDDEGSMFFANNEGLLKLSGDRWRIYPNKNESIIRSVKSIGDRIYSGSYMDFGFWIKDGKGNYQYTSLVEKINIKILENEEFWNILNYNNRIIFQSLNRLIILDPINEEVKFIQPKNPILKSYKVMNRLFFQESQRGLFSIDNGQPQLVNELSVLKKEILVGLFENKGKLLGLSNQSGFYEIENSSIKKWPSEIETFENNLTFYSAAKLGDDRFALGTISNGFILMDANGKMIHQMDYSSGISNNTVLSVFEDKNQNIWLGLDNGINCINTKSPFQEYLDTEGKLGTIYTTAVHREHLYLGTNQGLFVKKTNNETDKFEFIQNTKGQVWNLSIHNDELLCGHDQGVFVIDKKVAKKISDVNGCWIFKPLKNKPELLLKGNYDGIHVLRWANGEWKYNNKLKNYDMSSMFFEVVNDNTLLVSHEYKGVFQLTLDDEVKSITEIKKIESVEKGYNSCIASFNNKIYYHNPQGIYLYSALEGDFIKDNELSSEIQKDGYISGKMINNGDQNMWLFSKNKLHNLTRDSFSDRPNHTAYPISQTIRNSVNGHEHISNFSDETELLVTQSGYLLFNLKKYDPQKPEVFFDKIQVFENNSTPVDIEFNEETRIPFSKNNIHFLFHSKNYQKYDEVLFQYFLEGYSEKWSEWKDESEVIFKNLKPKEYTFKVRAKVGNLESSVSNSPLIKISPPWYYSRFMYLFYFLFLIIVLVVIDKYYKFYFQKKQEKFILKNKRILEIKAYENQQEIMKVKNEQLQRDIEHKNRELALSTMQTIKRNKLLNSLKNELKAIETDENVTRIIKIINNTLNKKDDWEFFEKAFNNADKDFFKKIKQHHPSLTNNDLQLCAYLRLNLSSKEIAPLLNISVRSVEIKRYRLRKKMNLLHDQGLVEYILTL